MTFGPVVRQVAFAGQEISDNALTERKVLGRGNCTMEGLYNTTTAVVAESWMLV